MQRKPESVPTFDLPMLRTLKPSGSIAVVGGAIRPRVLERLSRETGLELPWTEITSGGTRATESLADRVQRGSIKALVLVNNGLRHRHFQLISAAAERAGALVVRARAGGASQLVQALLELDREFARRRSAAA